MAAKVDKLGPTLTAAVIAAAVFMTNWVSAKYLNYPVAWCFGTWAIQPIVEPWLFVTHFMALGYFVFCVASHDAFKVVWGLMVVVLVYGAPTFMEILFRLGKSCN